MPTSPTQRTLKELRKRGYVAQVVEKWNPHAGIRQDLFGCIDVLAVGNGHNLGVQATVWGSVPTRRKKIVELLRGDKPIAAWLRVPGNHLEIWGWRATDDGVELRIEEVSLHGG